MFWGEYAHHLDDKGRLIIPARFRPHLAHGAILTRGLDRNLVIYPQASWQAVTERHNHGTCPLTTRGHTPGNKQPVKSYFVYAHLG